MNQEIHFESMQRINVIGTSGSGKSTFGKKLAAALGIPYLEMDKIFWGPDWGWPDDEVFFKKLELELQRENWLLDGNYTRTTPIKWQNVQLVIWLDYSLSRIMSRVIRRAVIRALTREELWEGTGNRESFKKLFSKDSIVRWSWNTYHDNRKKYNAAMANKKFAHIRFIRLSGPREAEKFLAHLK